jgi:soluble lytic murein transglycosylase-like protein
MTRTAALVLTLALAGGVCQAVPARAEIVVLASGRTLSVKSHRLEADRIVLALRGGGEVACDRALVDRIVPDEVPYPEPQAGTARAEDQPATLGGPFRDVITAAAERHGLEPRLLESVIRVESNFSERARSRKGAMGLMQLMPVTARHYEVDDPYDPAGNVDAGARHLRDLLNRFELPVALAAYNAGEAAVKRYGGVPPYRETRDYVARILRLTRRTPSKAN